MRNTLTHLTTTAALVSFRTSKSTGQRHISELRRPRVDMLIIQKVVCD